MLFRSHQLRETRLQIERAGTANVWVRLLQSAFGMESPMTEAQAGSFADLLRTVVHEGQTFLRVETALLKVEARETLKLAVLYLVLVMGSGLLLAIALSLIAAAIVLAADGSAIAALLSAAAVDVVVAAVAVSYMVLRIRAKSANQPEAPAAAKPGSSELAQARSEL